MSKTPASGGSELPVRVVEVVERDGRAVRALRVFCTHQGRSVDPAECVGCPRSVVVSDRIVVCSLPEASGPDSPGHPLVLGPDAVGGRTPVGAICTPRVLAFRVGAPSAALGQAIAREPFVVVLEDDDRVREIRSERFPSELPDQALLGSSVTLGEAAPLNEAIDWMVRKGRRVLPLADRSGRFVGVVTDLDLLRWARGRT